VLRRLIAGVALCALLAGCSGPSGPSAADRSICKTVRTEFDAITFFVRPTFDHELIRSHDPTFQRLGEALQRDAGAGTPVSQFNTRCSALGL
jgi:hypothetical protein